MHEILIQNAEAYASRNQLEIRDRLGFGVHGIVHFVEHKLNRERSAIKVHLSAEPYLRERRVYQRLSQASIVQLHGFNVPQLVSFDDPLRVIQMTVVRRPFLLDFAGAYLDTPPEFSDEIWAQWETEKREQF